MQKLSTDDSNSYIKRAARYHCARLLGNAKTKEIGGGFAELFARFGTALDAQNEAQFKATVIAGELGFADAGFDAAVASLNRSLLDTVNGDRSSATYRAFFPSGRIEETTRGPYERNADEAKRFLSASEAFPRAVAAEKVSATVEAASAVSTAIAAIAQQSALVGKHRGDVAIARVPLIRSYNEDHPRVQLLLTGVSEAQVESFFYRERRHSRRGGGESED